MASEFHVMSCLYRAGLEPLLTLGNKKAVDVYVIARSKSVLRVEVKSVAKRYDWMMGNRPFEVDENVWVALVCYNNRIADVDVSPDVWLMPATVIHRLIRVASDGKTRYLPRTAIGDKYDGYKNQAGWSAFTAAAV